jgi:hypothetical protein
MFNPHAGSAPASPPVVPATALPTYADQLLAVALAAAGQGLVTQHILSDAQLNLAVGDILSLIGLAYAVFAANPAKKSPIVWLLGLIEAAPKARQAQWNAAVAAAAEALIPRLEAAIDARIHAKAGILAGPIDSIANHEIGGLAASAEKAITLPQS